MKRLLTICAVAGFILAAAGLATADDVIIPEWADQPGTVVADWDSWTGFPGPMPPDGWESYPPGLPSPEAYAMMIGTPVLLPSFQGRNDVIELNGDYELEFVMPNFGESEENSYKEIWIQVTYYPTDSNQYPWFDVYAYIYDMSEPEPMGCVNWPDGWVTEAWSFQIWPNPATESIRLNFSGGEGPLYPAYVDQVVIDTWCVPEPATIALLGLGGLSLLRRKRSTNDG